MSTVEQLKARRDELNRELMSLHMKIMAAEQAESPESVFTINGKRVVRRGQVWGTHVRMELSPQTAGYPLFFENTGNNPDIQINDSDPIPNGARLYSIPPAINGG